MAAKFISSSPPPHTHTRKGGPGGWIFAGRIFQERRVETRRASFSGIGDRISSRSYGRGIIERAGNESLVSLPPPSYLHKYRRVYAGCCSLALSLSLSLSLSLPLPLGGVSSQPPPARIAPLRLSPSLSLSLSLFPLLAPFSPSSRLFSQTCPRTVSFPWSVSRQWWQRASSNRGESKGSLARRRDEEGTNAE